MRYSFKASIVTQDDQKIIKIPFNVWEVCDSKGTLSIKAKIRETTFFCDLLPVGNGIYNIPITDDVADKIKEDVFDMYFEILGVSSHFLGNSPYSTENPIRKIDTVELVTQPFDGLCGQTCIAMLAGVTLDEACEIMHCREWQANMCKIVDTLDYLFIPHAHCIHYTQGETVTLPNCAILLEKMGRYSHYLIYFDGTYLDPTAGILPEFDMKNMVGYLEILVD